MVLEGSIEDDNTINKPNATSILLSYTFSPTDRFGNIHTISITMIAPSNASVIVDGKNYNTLNLRRNQFGTVVSGKCSVMLMSIDITLAVNYHPIQPTFRIISNLYRDTFYFRSLNDFIGFKSFVMNNVSA